MREEIAKIVLSSWNDLEEMDLEGTDKVIADAIKSNIYLMDNVRNFDFLDVLFLITRTRSDKSEIQTLLRILEFLQIDEGTLICFYILDFYLQEKIEERTLDMLFREV